MQIVFKAVQGQSVVDVALNTYGSFNLLGKLISDNSAITDLNDVTVTGQELLYDMLLIEDQNLFDYIKQYGTRFVTGIGNGFILVENSAILQSEAGQNFIK